MSYTSFFFFSFFFFSYTGVLRLFTKLEAGSVYLFFIF
jgi:hypothetical protein